jgi:hypothetical protein
MADTMNPCPKHPHYTGGAKPDWNCRACREIRRQAKHPKQPEGETWIHRGEVSEVYKTTTENVRTLEELIKVCGIDTSLWIIEKWTASKTESPKGNPLYHLKAWLRAKSYLIGAREEIEELKKLARESMPSRTFTPSLSSLPNMDGNLPQAKELNTSDLLLEVNIPDLHLGKLAWSPETGYADYDSAKAEEIFEDALSALLERTVCYKFSEILLPLGNDILHSDTKFGTTTAGTQLDTDSRYHKNFARTRDLSIRSIRRLRDIAPVRVILVPGNHDTLSVWHLGDSLECFFHNTEGVSIDNSPCPRKYYQWGSVMLMFAHGTYGKLQDYPLLMATEQSSMFGNTKHREAHTGHTHQLKVQEKHGVRVRTISALCPPDAWHSEHGFVGNMRSAEAFVWSKTEGLIGTAIYTVQ